MGIYDCWWAFLRASAHEDMACKDTDFVGMFPYIVLSISPVTRWLVNHIILWRLAFEGCVTVEGLLVQTFGLVK